MHKFRFIILFFFCLCCESEGGGNNWWHIEATYMVKDQLERRGIQDRRVLEIMRETPRHLFVPANLKNMAYEDGPLPIGEGQTISQPYIVALMTELLKLNGSERVLEIGTGSGYQAAILSPLVKELYSIEIVKSLAEKADLRLKEMQYDNVIVKYGNGYKGWIEYSPFDAIIVTAAPNKIPQPLIDQLKVGGRLVLPIGDVHQELKVITKTGNDKIIEKNIIPVRFVPMVHFEKNASR